MTQDLKNKEFFEEIIQNHHNDPAIKISGFEIKSGIGKGENYGSTIWRAHIHWKRNNSEDGEEKLVIKTLAEDKSAHNIIIDLKLFETENLYYNKVLPMYKSILARNGIKNYSKLAPTYLKCNKPNVVILEDLAPLGFRLGDRQNGVDFNHGLLLVKALARNHALSIAINRKIPGFFDNKGSKAFIDDYDNINLFFSNPMKEHIDTLKDWPEFQEYVGRIQAITAEEFSKFGHAGELKAVCQGDCWINNMLFRYDEATGTPEEVCLLDFQIYFWGSLVFDVIYFIYTSLSPEVLEHKKHILYHEYIEELHKWMKDLGEELGEYTRDNILKDFKKLQYFGVILVMSVLYLITCDPKDALNFDNLEDQGGKLQRDKIRNNPTYKQKLLKHLQLFAKENII